MFWANFEDSLSSRGTETHINSHGNIGIVGQNVAGFVRFHQGDQTPEGNDWKEGVVLAHSFRRFTLLSLGFMPLGRVSYTMW